jgi:GntR family transcriptional regulator
MLENLKEMGKHSTVRVVATETVVPPAEIRGILGLENGALVQKVVRVRSNEDGEPYVYYLSWTVGITRAFTRKKLENHTRLDLLRKNNIQLSRVEQVLSAENASIPIAEELDVEPGTALLWIRRLGSVEDGPIVDVLDGFYNPKRFQYAMVSSID